MITKNNKIVIEKFIKDYIDIDPYKDFNNVSNMFELIGLIEHKFEVVFDCRPMIKPGKYSSVFFKNNDSSNAYACKIISFNNSNKELIRITLCKNRIDAYQRAMLSFISVKVIGDTDINVDPDKRLKVEISTYLLEVWDQMGILPKNHTKIVQKVYEIGDWSLFVSKEERLSEIKTAFQKLYDSI